MGRGVAVGDLESLPCAHSKNMRIISATLLLKHDRLGGWVEGTISKPVRNIDDRVFQRPVRSCHEFLAHYRRGMHFQTSGISSHVNARRIRDRNERGAERRDRLY